jgi:prepilin-type processing-associated H-X9-DG protein
MPWVLEAANDFPGTGPGGIPQIFLVQYHDVYSPDHLPRQAQQRISDDRHYKRQANVLYLDAHVGLIRRGELTLQMLDDGLRVHATGTVDTGRF